MRLDLLLPGYAELAVPEEEAAALFETLRREGISPKGVKRYEKNGELHLLFTYRSAARIKALFPHLRLCGKGGVPALWAVLCRRPGMLCGILLALCLLIGARLFLWDIRVEGNEILEEEEVLTALSAAGLTKGRFLPLLDGEAVALEARLQEARLGYVTVNLQGTVALVQVRESVSPPDSPPASPANLVAARDGVITLPLIFEGEVLVKEGDVVRAGQILAGGLMDSEKHGVIVTRAAGSVLARTTHVYRVEVPLLYEEKVYTGGVGREISLLFFGLEGKIFKNMPHNDKEYDIIKNIKWGRLPGGGLLPVGLAVTAAPVYTLQRAQRTAEEALALARSELERELAADAPGRALLEKTVEVQADADGVTLICTVVCEEDIALTAEFSYLSR